MGAHSLGRMRTENTGYNGAWTPSRENTFDNEFYRLLVDQNVEFRNRVRKRFLFNKPENLKLFVHVPLYLQDASYHFRQI